MGTDGTFGHEDQPTSVLSTVAKTATPVVEPLGVTEENWPATVGLITGFLAKEVVVGALDALYQNMDKEPETNIQEGSEDYLLGSQLAAALQTIPNNFQVMWQGLLDPLGLQDLAVTATQEATAEAQEIAVTTLDKMIKYFDGHAGAYAYLLLVLLYFPCVATFGAIKQELGWRWALTSGAWSLFLGYSVAVSFYQISTWQRHPETSALWLSFFAIVYVWIYFMLKRFGRIGNPNHDFKRS